ncbi:hypothetical protein M9Y10_007883 [Tritrichomonas musculus]|uniref:Uncharacterized protein n=1 Tax=Tritrichomonas musculus TaxID=1915356 RepID=A0ABR2J3M7_9EUKA
MNEDNPFERFLLVLGIEMIPFFCFLCCYCKLVINFTKHHDSKKNFIICSTMASIYIILILMFLVIMYLLFMKKNNKQIGIMAIGSLIQLPILITYTCFDFSFIMIFVILFQNGYNADLIDVIEYYEANFITTINNDQNESLNEQAHN